MGSRFEIYKELIPYIEFRSTGEGVRQEIDPETGNLNVMFPNNSFLNFTDIRFRRKLSLQDETTTTGDRRKHSVKLFGNRGFILNVTRNSVDKNDKRPGRVITDNIGNPIGRVYYLGDTNE